jgi:hypothetical protein
VTGASNSLFYDTYLSFHFWHVFVRSGRVQDNSQREEVVLHGDEFSIHESGSDMKSSRGVQCLDEADRSNHHCHFSATDEFDGGKPDMITDSHKERLAVDEEYVAADGNVLVSFHDLWWDGNVVRDHWVWGASHSLPFQNGDTGAVDLLGPVDVISGHRTVGDQVGLDDIFQVMGAGKSNCGLESPRGIGPLAR